MNVFDLLIFVFTVIVAVYANLRWYGIKNMLEEQGYETHLFYGHFKDLSHFSELISKERDPLKKKKYRKLQVRLFFNILLFLVLGLIIMVRVNQQ
jgi:hypothetical protein